MTIAQGINKQTTFEKQSGLGVPGGGAGGKILRRVTSVFTLAKDKYSSEEIVTHQQVTSNRHGTRTTNGKLSGQLSAGTYAPFIGSLLRKDFAAVAPYAAGVDVTASASPPHFTDAGGAGFLASGLKVGDVVRWTGWTTGGAGNNDKNFWITSLTATQMSGLFLNGDAVAAKASGDSVTVTVVGKKSLVPLIAHTRDYYTFEEWYPDIVRSELFTDVMPGQASFELPGNGNLKFNMDLVGLDRADAASQQFTTPAAETTTGLLGAVSGRLQVDGVSYAVVTGLNFSVNGNVSHLDPVIGSTKRPDLQRGRIMVTGQFTAYFENGVLPAIFMNETNVAIIVVATEDNTPTSNFMAFTIGRVKVFGDAPDDGEKGIVRTYQIEGELNSAGGAALAFDQTIISVQDSAA